MNIEIILSAVWGILKEVLCLIGIPYIVGYWFHVGWQQAKNKEEV